MGWQEDGVKLKTYVSTAGDYVKLGTSTVYPFVAGGGGIPNGWTQYLSNGAVAGDVSWDTTYGRFSIGNLTTDTHNAKLYGIYRDFTVPTGKRWLIQVQCRTTKDRTTSIRYVKWGNTTTTYQSTQVWSYSDWEQISLATGTWNQTVLRVWLYAAPYELSTHHDPVDANWGIQFQNVTLVQMEPTYPEPTWQESTCDTLGLDVHYGRDKFTNRYDVATAQIKLANDDGDYNYQTNAQVFRPGRFVKVTAWRPWGSNITYNMFYGVIDSVSQDFTLDGKAYTSLSCLDTSTLVSTTTVPTFMDEFDIVGSGSRFRNILSSVGYHPNKYTGDSGVYSMQAILANSRTVRDELGLIADSEGGYFFTDRSGTLIFRDRTWDAAANTTVTAELLATPTMDTPKVDTVPNNDASILAIVPLKDIKTDWSRDRVVNEVQVANQGGTAIITVDAASQKKYGPRTYQRLDLLNDNAHPEYLDQRTSDLMTGYTDAILRVNSVEFEPTENLHYYLCQQLWFGDLVRVRYEHPTTGWGFAIVTRIQGYTQSITPQSWRAILSLDQPITFTSWITPASPMGWDVSKWDMGHWDQTPGGAYFDRGYQWGAQTNVDISKWGL